MNAGCVETVEQLRALPALGGNEIQGYLHGRTEPSEAIAASLIGQGRPPTIQTAAE